jgi:hypothetical protein
MDTEQAIILWSTRWALMAGAVVCGDCQRRQVLGASDHPFDHGHGCCDIKDAGGSQWAELHDVPHAARG